MPSFRVLRFDLNAKMSAEHRNVEAQDEREAAERVCGAPLIDVGKPGQLRAQVNLEGKPSNRTMFYVRD